MENIRNIKVKKNGFGEDILTFEIGDHKFSYIEGSETIGIDANIEVIFFEKGDGSNNISINGKADAERKAEAERIIDKIKNM